jgi:hypothetical protein
MGIEVPLDVKIIKDQRAPYHEAGHALVAKKLNIRLLGVGFSDGHPAGEGGLATGVVNKNDQDNPIFLAAGMAAEEILFGSYDPEGSVTDSASIAKAGASVRESIDTARGFLDRDAIVFIGKRIESFALQNDSGYIPEANLFAEEN